MKPSRVLASIMLVASFAHARDIEVSTDSQLASALKNARPGDTIRLAAGTYRGGIHVSVAGEKERPIVITSSDKDKPATIQGQSGLHLAGAKFVTLRHLIVKGSTANGINIDDAGRMDQSAVGIRIESCQVLDTGPRGNLDGIKLSGLRDFVITDTLVTGWGGSAIDMVGCAEGVIEKSRIVGKPGFDQASGIQMKGGSQNLRVEQNTFTSAGARALNVGGSTGLQFFRPLDAPHEAKDITIENNLFHGGEAPVAFVGVDGAIFRHNTIVRPGKWVMRILQESTDERFARCRNVVFERNMIVYSSRSVRTIANIGPNTQPETFRFVSNWWFCTDAPGSRPDLPSRETGGVYGRDPGLGDDGMPSLDDAAKYGMQGMSDH